ncbi:Threonine/homoserine efflux transporter RhtA [Desulfocicer vacuolatum DSM 3385]|uniref:Threonine/homoserine efflux transporter RhtA n=1 Tax=Desulfocicer vacuolatum DSM 3385 TaxID=1121400 RepID=A0A1W2DH66_9BACT|nr:DMT family transporter [Desulfocicer vacuolatum]SMC96248.1 Threonine/homoserine efflux transporter RhtA [Desulfocicer vacuolatum DSM 3385]
MPHNQLLTPDQAMLRTTLGATMISFSAVWVKLAHVTPTASAFYRVFLGGIFLTCFMLMRKQRMAKKDLFSGLSMLAGIFFALDLYVWHLSIQYVGPGLATILSNFQVFMVPLAGLLLYGEALNIRFILSVPLAVAGLFMIIGIPWEMLSPDYHMGIWYGFLTAVFYTGFLIVLRKLQSHNSRPSAALNLMVISFATAAFLALEMVRTHDTFAVPDIKSALALMGLGLMSQTVGWLFITRSLPRIPAAVAGLILLLQPSLAFVWDVLFFHRETSPMAWCGVALSLSSIYLGSTSGKSSPRSSELKSKA